MIRFGIISPPVTGHINPFAALGRELIARGHRVTFFGMLDLEQKITREELEFAPIGQADHPRGSLAESLSELGKLKGLSALRFTIRAVARTSAMVCRDAPDAVRAAGVDALLVDQMEPAGGAVAEHLGMPFVTICNALAINRDPVAPPPFTDWRYREGGWARLRNAIGYASSDWLTRPIADVVRQYRATWKLPTLRAPDDSFSKLAQISQMPRAFDFPRVHLPDNFHYVGPLRRAQAESAPFPWHKLDGRPLVYSSLGTLQNRREPLFRVIAESCAGLGVQLVIAHGGGLSDVEGAQLPGDPLVVGYAPQLDVLARAQLTITHAGLNTVLDSLSCGVPLVAIPLTYEQPAIGRRVERVGAGRTISIDRLTPDRLRSAVKTVLNRTDFRTSAGHMRDAIVDAGGIRRAATIIDDILARSADIAPFRLPHG
jgi:MGT family glycosyltransferase